MQGNVYKAPLIDSLRACARRILKSSSIGKFLYPIVQRVWQSYSKPQKRRRLQRYGFDVLDRMHKLLSENSVPYYCDCGTLIGFLRDKGFIKHDDDIDIAIMPNSVSPQRILSIFRDAGYGFVHAFQYDGRIIEFTVVDYTGVTIDVFLHEWEKEVPGYLKEIFIRWYKDRSYPNEKANIGLRFSLRGPDGLKELQIGGVTTMIPTNAEEVLDSEYGPWRRPDPNFKSEQIKNEELPGYVMRLTLEEALAFGMAREDS